MPVEKKRFAVSLILIALTLILPPTLTAQTKTAPMDDWSLLSAVEPSSKLNVKLKNGKTVEGNLISVSDTVLKLSVKKKPLELKPDEVRRVYQLKKKSAAKTTLIGLAVGAGAGAVVGAALRDSDTILSIDKVENAAHAGVTVLGAGAGALTGYVVGRSRRKRVLVYETSQP